jgi:hypothetical protein
MEDVSVNARSPSVFESVNSEHCLNIAGILADFQTQAKFALDPSWHKKFTFNVQTREEVDNVIEGLVNTALKFPNKGKVL